MKRQRDPRVTREALIGAATELFAQHGFEGASVARIARRAKVNRSLISYHFGGKRRLYLAILQEAFSQIGERIDALLESKEPPEERLNAFIGVFHEMAQKRPAFPQLMVREVIDGGRNLDQRIIPHLLKVFKLIREILVQGQREGRFRSTNPVLTHIALVSSLVFFFATGAFRRRMIAELGPEVEPVETHDYIRYWGEMICRGLTADRTGGAILHTESSKV